MSLMLASGAYANKSLWGILKASSVFSGIILDSLLTAVTTQCPVLLYGVNLPTSSLSSVLLLRLGCVCVSAWPGRCSAWGHLGTPVCMPNSKHLPTCRSGTSDFQNVSAKLHLLLRVLEARNIRHKLDDLHGCMLRPCFMNTGVVPKLNSGVQWGAFAITGRFWSVILALEKGSVTAVLWEQTRSVQIQKIVRDPLPSFQRIIGLFLWESNLPSARGQIGLNCVLIICLNSSSLFPVLLSPLHICRLLLSCRF